MVLQCSWRPHRACCSGAVLARGLDRGVGDQLAQADPSTAAPKPLLLALCLIIQLIRGRKASDRSLSVCLWVWKARSRLKALACYPLSLSLFLSAPRPLLSSLSLSLSLSLSPLSLSLSVSLLYPLSSVPLPLSCVDRRAGLRPSVFAGAAACRSLAPFSLAAAAATAAMPSCPSCKSSETEVDEARGTITCTACGTVLEDNIIVSEVRVARAASPPSSPSLL